MFGVMLLRRTSSRNCPGVWLVARRKLKQNPDVDLNPISYAMALMLRSVFSNGYQPAFATNELAAPEGVP